VVDQGVDSIFPQRDAAVEADQQCCHAVFESGESDTRVELAEERVGQGPVIADADVAEAGNKELDQEGFGEIAEGWLERADRGCLRAGSGFQRKAVFHEERAGAEHGVADRARGHFPIRKSKGVSTGFAAGLVGGVTDEP